jgi:3-hydroxyethyl bacteriochlorophyllide a dehydrogenase
LDTLAVVIEAPERLSLQRLRLRSPTDTDVVVDVEWTGVSTGTERLLWSGRMPPFPGLGYPLVPGYETVGRVREAGSGSTLSAGTRVFVPGADCYGPVRGLFGGTAQRVVVDASRVVPIPEELEESGCLLALAATAWHALDKIDTPGLVVGHGALGRLIARLSRVRFGVGPTVWDTRPERRVGASGYSVLAPEDDPRQDYASIIDVSGQSTILDDLFPRLARGGTVVLAGFYSDAVRFEFPPAFLKEADVRIAAEWQPSDLAKVVAQASSGALDLGGIISHRSPATEATHAYTRAFGDPECVKLVLDWRSA